MPDVESSLRSSLIQETSEREVDRTTEAYALGSNAQI